MKLRRLKVIASVSRFNKEQILGFYRKIFSWGVVLLMCFISIEITIFLSIKYLGLPISFPSYSLNSYYFWEDINTDFGVWHRPNGSFIHKKACFEVQYRSNSYGARDKERTLKNVNGKKRVVVLGDSMIEGIGTKRGKRLSDLLESASGLEHLNFGTAGSFGLTQQAILYEKLAMKFDHDYVVIGMLPVNDFLDDSLKSGKAVHTKRYRPYYVGTYPNYKTIYFRTEIRQPLVLALKDFLQKFTYSFNLASYAKAYIRYINEEGTIRDDSGYSGYYQYSSEELLKAKFSIKKIVDLANSSGKQVLLFTVPYIVDFMKFEESGVRPPLPAELSEISEELEFEYLDLFPTMRKLSKNGDYENFFHTCDGHWSDYGNQIASELLIKESFLYQNLQ